MSNAQNDINLEMQWEFLREELGKTLSKEIPLHLVAYTIYDVLKGDTKHLVAELNKFLE